MLPIGSQLMRILQQVRTLPATEMTSPALTSELGLQPDRQFTRTSPGAEVREEQRLAVLARRDGWKGPSAAANFSEQPRSCACVNHH